MAWTAPITFYDGDPLTAAQLNTFVADNLNATAPGIAVTPHQFIVSSGKNSLAARQWVRYVDQTFFPIEAEWPADPDEEAEQGPTVTFPHGGSFLLLYSCFLRVETGTGAANYCPVITDGPGEINDVYEYGVRNSSTSWIKSGSHALIQGVEPGVTTVTMKYGSTPGSGAPATTRYSNRKLTAIPL